MNDAFRKRDFHKDEPFQIPITDGIDRQDAVCDDGPEDHLLPCKDELCWDSDESSENDISPNTGVKQEPVQDDLDHADELLLPVKTEPPSYAAPHPRRIWQKLPLRQQEDSYRQKFPQHPKRCVPEKPLNSVLEVLDFVRALG